MAEKLKQALANKKENFEEENIKWINVIFIPFQTWWQFIILIAVISKCFFGPLLTVFPIFQCSGLHQENDILFYIKIFNDHVSDSLYAVDTFLYLVHRQVSEEAMKKEFRPKPAVYLILDMISILPLSSILNDNICGVPKLWPNMVAFVEFLVVYRIGNFFSVNLNHNPFVYYTGYFLLMVITIHAINCFHLLFTFNGYCEHCHNKTYDWRKYLKYVLRNTTNENLYLYYAGYYQCSVYLCNTLTVALLPYTYLEFIVFALLTTLGYLISAFTMKSKLFLEGIYRAKALNDFHSRVQRIVEETQRRDQENDTHEEITAFFKFIWMKHKGLLSMPEAKLKLPFRLQADVMEDLAWPIFYHSPTFRGTSVAFKRWLGRFMRITYKQPNERFFVGRHCLSNLYYLKNGIVQILSLEDSTAPLLSMTSGTIFGDVSFIVPPTKRKVIARCLTFCEVYVFNRYDILSSLHKFPEDRRYITRIIKVRMNHAKRLYACKKLIPDKDRAQDEGLSWLKHRWWEISRAFKKFGKASSKSKRQLVLKSERVNYHCSKYIGQLVLCGEINLQTQPMFLKTQFPWIISPHSTFVKVWYRFVQINVYLALLAFPPNLVRDKEARPLWFTIFGYFINVLYTLDVFVVLITGSLDDKYNRDSTSLFLHRIKQPFFILDFLSTDWITKLIVLQNDMYLGYFQFNRLLKSYMIFFSRFGRNSWEKRRNALIANMKTIFILNFMYHYVIAFWDYLFSKHFLALFPKNYEDEVCHDYNSGTNQSCLIYLPKRLGILNIAFDWIIDYINPTIKDERLADFPYLFVEYFLNIFSSFWFISAIYLAKRDYVSYQYFVSNLKKHYIRLGIHPDLLKRLDNYLECHWSHFQGVDIMFPTLLKDEPYDIYYKLHGQVAERIIGESKPFNGASPQLIRNLAEEAKYLILPKGATLIMFGSQIEKVTWIVNGVLSCEYQKENGETLKTTVPAGETLSIISVFLNRASLKTYIAATDVEVLYIKVNVFFTVYKKFIKEWEYFKIVKEEIGPLLDEIYVSHVKKHRQYQRKLRQEVFHANALKSTGFEDHPEQILIPDYIKNFRRHPESKIIQHWLMFRVVIILIQTFIEYMKIGVTPETRDVLDDIKIVLRIFCVLDIVVKLFLPYYDEYGLVVTEIKKCAFHYITRGFALDVLGNLFAVKPFVRLILRTDMQSTERILATRLSSIFHFYLLIGFFQYNRNKPASSTLHIGIAMWVTACFVCCLYMAIIVTQYCIDGDALYTRCWMPMFFNLPKTLNSTHKHLVVLEALHYIQSAAMRHNVSEIKIDAIYYEMTFIYLIIGLAFWLQRNNCRANLFLLLHGDSLFNQEVNQLTNFLKEERVDKKVISRAVNYFSYWWKRTSGVDMKILMNERISSVFRQDLNYYFFKKTLQIVDNHLHGGETLGRMIARSVVEVFILANEDVVRENELSPDIYIVHRGAVVITRSDDEITVLRKGSIFGQLQGTKLRPLRISVRTTEPTDLLKISVEKFQRIVNDDVRHKINRNPQSKFDFMTLKRPVPENPYNNIQFLLRGAKVIQFPNMSAPVTSETSKWYERWLLLVWFIFPVTTFALILYLMTTPTGSFPSLWIIVVILDVIYLGHFLTDSYYTMELFVVGQQCVYRYTRLQKFFKVWSYFDVLSLILPFMTLKNKNWGWQLTRLLRSHSLYFYYKYFCKSFKDQNKATILKISVLFLLVHALTCGWILVACKPGRNDTSFPIEIYKVPENSAEYEDTDFSSWTYPDIRGSGCAKTRHLLSDVLGKKTIFIVPTDWRADYLVSLFCTICRMTYVSVYTCTPLDVNQIAYAIFSTHVLFFVDLWIVGLVISTVNLKFHELYQFDFEFGELIEFLKFNGVSKYLIQSIRTYVKVLWQKQKGCWLPELTQQAPLCLREDIMSSLYIHHLLCTPLFENMPLYFLKQIAVRMKRVVHFPGKCVVHSGNISPVLYFIHEGEVEKWAHDQHGDTYLVKVLTINDHFGLLPGLFPNTPFRHSFYTRTVADFVYLSYAEWQDILNAYPQLKFELYIGGIKLRNERLRKAADK